MVNTISAKDLIRALNELCDESADEDIIEEADYDTSNECFYLDAMPRSENLPSVLISDVAADVRSMSPKGTHLIRFASEADGDGDGSALWTTWYLVHHQGKFAQLAINQSDYCDDETDACWTLSDITTDPALIHAAVGDTLRTLRAERAAALKSIDDSAAAMSGIFSPFSGLSAPTPATPRQSHTP